MLQISCECAIMSGFYSFCSCREMDYNNRKQPRTEVGDFYSNELSTLNFTGTFYKTKKQKGAAMWVLSYVILQPS